jgi:predicted ATPase
VTKELRFLKRLGPFTLDTQNECVWSGGRQISLTPKAYAVLECLVANAGRLVKKEELLDRVWANVFVQEAVLKVHILEIRRALQDSISHPTYIATVHRRGYRFICPVTELAGTTNGYCQSELIAREEELRRLHELFDRCSRGERQLALVSGEAGAGKSILVSHFLETIGAHSPVQVFRGQCLRHLGPQEAFYPIFDALARAIGLEGNSKLRAALRTYAPSWFVQMPALLDSEPGGALKHRALTGSRERMLREMCDALQSLSTACPLVLVLEDLHLCDAATLDLLAALTGRDVVSRLLVIGTYRPVEVIISDHPLKYWKQTVVPRNRFTEIVLPRFTRRDIETFLEIRLGLHEFTPGFVGLLENRTDGNPLFVSAALSYLVLSGLIAQNSGIWKLTTGLDNIEFHIPESLVEMIQNHIERLSPEEQTTLELASVAGMTFEASQLADSDSLEERRIQDICDALVKRNLFLEEAEIAPGQPEYFVPAYSFKHVLYKDVLYRRLPKTQRYRLHREIEERVRRKRPASLNDVKSWPGGQFLSGFDHI